MSLSVIVERHVCPPEPFVFGGIPFKKDLILINNPMQEIEITKWIVRVDESKPRDQATLVGFDKAANEYTFTTRYYEGGEWHDAPTDIIVSDSPKANLT